MLAAWAAKEVVKTEFVLTVGRIWKHDGRIPAPLASDLHIPRVELPLG